MKKGIYIGLGLAVTSAIVYFGYKWWKNNQKETSPPPTSGSIPVTAHNVLAGPVGPSMQ